MRNIVFSLLFWICSTGSSSMAFAQSLSLSELKSLMNDLQNISEIKEMNCTLLAPSSHSKVFLFDGDLGYCPRYFLMEAPQTSGSYPGLSLAQRISQTLPNSENEIYLKAIETSLSSEKRIKNCLLVKTFLVHMNTKLVQEKSELYYYSKRGEKEASACARNLVERADQAGVAFHLRVLAYSMGSEAALRFAQRLLPVGIGIESIQSIDPVGRNVNWTTGVITTEDNSLFKAPKNVNEWINFFQKQDRYSLLHSELAHLGIRGSRVIGAIVNHEFAANDFLSEEDRKHGHVHILTQPLVLKAMSEQLSERF